MRAFVASLSVVALVLLSAACSSGAASSTSGTSGSGGGHADPGSCAKGKVACSGANQAFCCADYAGDFTATTVQNDCNVSGGVYSAEVCSTAGRIGSCTLYPGTVAEKTIRYYTGYMGDPSKGCATLHGTWAPN